MNTLELLTAIKRAAGVPAYQVRFSDTDFLSLADEETRTIILPMVTNMREDYLVAFAQITVAQGVQAYPVPERAVAQSLRELKFQITGQNYVIDLPYVPIEQQYSSFYSAQPVGYNFQGDDIYIINPPSTAGKLFCWYVMRPGTLVESTSVATVLTIPTDNTVTVSGLPTAWGAAAIVDGIPKRNGSHIPKIMDAAVTIAGVTLTFDPTIYNATNRMSDLLVVGDHIALAGQTDLVQLPTETQDVLVQAVKARIHQGLGQEQQHAAALQELDRKIRSAMDLLAPRNEGATAKVVHRNGMLNGRFIRRPNIMRG